MDRIATLRLEVVPATVVLLDAELESNDKLASLLNAHVPDGWPPGEYDEPAIKYFRDRLIEHPDTIGWNAWYALLRPPVGGLQILVGAGGFFGPPDRDGMVEIGYSIVPAYEGRGLATELVRALVHHAFSDARVKRIIAHTTEENIGSVKVLERTGFAIVGPGRDPGAVEYGQRSPAT
jgi:[ribosomal protein S5]-alanine N-acetyltransferase